MTYSTTTTAAAIAPATGLLISVTDQFGRQLSFTYNAQKRVAKLIDPAGGETLFEYDGPSGPPGAKNLTKITFPDSKSRTYHYGESAHINGGIAYGLDRICALAAGSDSIRDVIAFPKTASGSDALTGAPAPVDERQLRELGISIRAATPR